MPGLWVSFFGLFLNALAMAKFPPRHICIYFPIGVTPPFEFTSKSEKQKLSVANIIKAIDHESLM